MPQKKQKKGFVAPFSQSGSNATGHHTAPTELPSKQKEEKIVAMSPVHLGRNIQTITPHTRRKIKQRFAYAGLWNTSMQDSSPGINVPFELSQASCISRNSVDTTEDVYKDIDAVEESNEPEEVERLDDQGEDEFDLQLSQDELKSTQDACDRIATDKKENTEIDDTRKDIDTNANLLTEEESIPIVEPTTEYVTEVEEFVDNTNALKKGKKDGKCSKDSKKKKTESIENGVVKKTGNVERDLRRKSKGVKGSRGQNEHRDKKNKGALMVKKGEKTAKTLKMKRKRILKVKMSCRKTEVVHSMIEGDSPAVFETNGKKVASSMNTCRNPGANTCIIRKRRSKRSLQKVKEDVLLTLNKMHCEIQELNERRKQLIIVDDQGSKLELPELAKSLTMTQEE